MKCRLNAYDGTIGHYELEMWDESGRDVDYDPYIGREAKGLLSAPYTREDVTPARQLIYLLEERGHEVVNRTEWM